MRLTVLGGTGGWPTAGTACNGYLAELALARDADVFVAAWWQDILHRKGDLQIAWTPVS